MFSRVNPVKNLDLGTGLTFGTAADFAAVASGGSAACTLKYDDSAGESVYIWKMRLTAGTAYNFTSGDEMEQPYNQLYNAALQAVGSVFYGVGSFTPTVSGVYYLRQSFYYDFAETLAVSPVPDSAAATIYSTAAGFNQFGKLVRYASAVSAGLVRPGLKSGLVFHAPLAAAAATAETGQPLTVQGTPEYSVCDGIPCLDTQNGYLSSEVLNLRGAAPQTLSIWLKILTPSSVGGALAHGSGGGMSMAAIGADGTQAFASFFGASVDYRYGVNLTDKMHHFALTYDGEFARGYIDGAFVRMDSPGAINITSDAVHIGASFDFRTYAYLAAARVYNRVLDLDEIVALANEFDV